ncbi:MAG: DUF1553 domain-containing protein [Planctomycetaceae bacterium]|nr:DUF1553 domain-containing protein [Planctomycetaceae bacterium]
MMKFTSTIILTMLFVVGGQGLSADERRPLFEDDIQPILTKKCGQCHDDIVKSGGLDLTSMIGLKKGGESGESAIAETVDDSLLWIMIDGGGMPPEDEPPLTAAELATIKSWLAVGARAKGPTEVQITQHDVLPYLFARCVVCHGRHKQEGGLDLRTVASIRKGGKSGPAVVPGKPDESLILQKVLSKDMPPPKEIIRAGVRPMESAEIELLRKWIAQGAKAYDIQPSVQTAQPDPVVTDEDRQFWSFQPPQKAEIPEIAGANNPIDAFLLRKLRDNGLGYSKTAPKLKLIRRVCFDLTGLPPEWDDVQRFVNDESPDWYERMVDHYLDSPHYGEHLGRMWLDLAGYADSEGKRSADPIRKHSWRYRDYVIRAFNDDKPYDRFLTEQIAGDELYDFENAEEVTPEMMDALVATGFLRQAPDGTGSDIVDTVEERFEVVSDEIDVLGSSVLGLTLRCAQCHSHKYDPIPHRDYFRLVATFQGAYDVYDWLKPTSVANQSKQKNPTRRFLPYISTDIERSWETEKEKIEEQIADVKQKLADQITEQREAYLNQQLADLPADMEQSLREMLKTPQEKRSDEQQALAKQYEAQLTISDKDLLKQNSELAKLEKETDKQVKSLQKQMPDQPMIRALWDRGEPSPTWVFRRGEFNNPGELVGPGVLSVLTDGQTPFEPASLKDGTTGRRLAFAKWLTDAEHPLTSRVIVNRLWHHHFGRGIVESLSNFGNSGVPPTHPELLDWLAVSFVENGWSFKWLHKQIMTSAAYRQSSQIEEDLVEKDPANARFSRMPLKRVRAESVRDSLLAVSGELDTTQFGEPDTVTVRKDGLVTANKYDEGWRRSIYVRQRRKEIPTILENFDLPQMSPNCVERPNSMVAPQALHLLNNSLIRELSVSFAERVEADVPEDRDQQIERVYQLAFSRPPSDEERTLSHQTLDALTEKWKSVESDQESDRSPESRALANYCHVILNSAEFLFVD